jgi:hypothetical protein
MRRGLSLFAGLLVAATFTSAAIACSCRDFPNAGVQFGKTDLLFVGRVVETRSEPRGYGRVYVTRFEVSRTLKGRSESSREVRYDSTAVAMCGVRFEVGEDAFVGADVASDGQAWTSACAMPRFSLKEFEAILPRT